MVECQADIINFHKNLNNPDCDGKCLTKGGSFFCWSNLGLFNLEFEKIEGANQFENMLNAIRAWQKWNNFVRRFHPSEKTKKLYLKLREFHNEYLEIYYSKRISKQKREELIKMTRNILQFYFHANIKVIEHDYGSKKKQVFNFSK